MADNLDGSESVGTAGAGSEGLANGDVSAPADGRGQSREALIARYEQEDQAAVDREDGVGPEDVDDDANDQGYDEDSIDESEHTEDDTDGDAGESDSDSDDDDDSDTDAADDADDESDDDADADEETDDDQDDADTDGDDEDEEVSAEAKAALTKNGANLSLDDIPKKFRGIVEAKLKSIDRAFTKTQQEATTFRTEQRATRAEALFRKENPEFVVVDMLRNGGVGLFDKVNKMLNGMDPNADGATDDSVKDAETIFLERLERKREKANASVDAEERANTETVGRAQQLEDHARTVAKQLGVPFNRTIEKLLVAEILTLPDSKRAQGLTSAQVESVVKGYAKDHRNSTRATVREDRKRDVRSGTERRQKPKPTVKSASGTASPGAAGTKKPVVDFNNSESRIAAGMKAAKRIMPGRK